MSLALLAALAALTRLKGAFEPLLIVAAGVVGIIISHGATS